MLWQKFWIEARWRFLAGLAVLVCSAVAVVVEWPTVQRLLPLALRPEIGGDLGRRGRQMRGLRRDVDRPRDRAADDPF